tara:strand:- start:1855 stop:2067 length:213 start_codon:yes stop_codon:yes gene_type:complete
MELREATGGDWAWYMTTYAQTEQHPTPTQLICRLTDATPEAVEALAIPVFRELYRRASESILGDEDAEPE